MASWAQDHGFLRFYSIVGQLTLRAVNVRLLLLAPCAGPSGGEDEAGKPSGGRRKGDPRHGRRVAPGRCRSLQSEELSRQFGKAVGSSRGQIGVWTGLIIPAPIWREGKDSLSGMRSHGWRSRGFGP